MASAGGRSPGFARAEARASALGVLGVLGVLVVLGVVGVLGVLGVLVVLGSPAHVLRGPLLGPVILNQPPPPP